MAVKVAGAFYLLWLGIQSIRSARSTGNDDMATYSHPAPVAATTNVRQGFMVGVGNPKSIVSLMAILPQFVDHGLGHPTLQVLIIGLGGGLAQVLIETLWVCAAGALRTWFQRRPSRVRHLKTGGGIAMIGLGGRLAFER